MFLHTHTVILNLPLKILPTQPYNTKTERKRLCQEQYNKRQCATFISLNSRCGKPNLVGWHAVLDQFSIFFFFNLEILHLKTRF